MCSLHSPHYYRGGSRGGEYKAHPPPSPIVTFLHWKPTSDDLATISMISDNRTIFFCLGTDAIHREMPKVGVVTRLRMRIVHDLVNSLPLNSPL